MCGGSDSVPQVSSSPSGSLAIAASFGPGASACASANGGSSNCCSCNGQNGQNPMSSQIQQLIGPLIEGLMMGMEMSQGAGGLGGLGGGLGSLGSPFGGGSPFGSLLGGSPLGGLGSGAFAMAGSPFGGLSSMF